MERRTHFKSLRLRLDVSINVLRSCSRSQLAKAIHVKITSGGWHSFVLGLSLFDDLCGEAYLANQEYWGMGRTIGVGLLG
jgi:hypothetical protein